MIIQTKKNDCTVIRIYKKNYEVIKEKKPDVFLLIESATNLATEGEHSAWLKILEACSIYNCV